MLVVFAVVVCLSVLPPVMDIQGEPKTGPLFDCQYLQNALQVVPLVFINLFNI